MQDSTTTPNTADRVAAHMQAELDGALDGSMQTMPTKPRPTSAPVKACGANQLGVPDTIVVT